MALPFRAGFLKVSQFGESSPRQHEPELMDDYEPYYAFRWVVTLPRQNPVIADRQCMSRVSWRRRLARQVWPHTRLRDCCWLEAAAEGFHHAPQRLRPVAMAGDHAGPRSRASTS
jgi:hypothetical protein